MYIEGPEPLDGLMRMLVSGKSETTTPRRGAHRGARPAFARRIIIAHFAVALMVLADQQQVRAAQDCGGDCDLTGQVSAADLVQMIDIAAGNTELSACFPGDATNDGQITGEDIATAIHNVFAGCPEQLPRYDALTGQIYDVAYPERIVSVTQAAAIVAALEEIGSLSEDELRALLSQLLQENGVQADNIGHIVIYQRQAADDCDDCLATCKGRCVQSPRGDCFCYEPLPTDPPPSGLVILLLEDPGDEAMALDADRIPCKAAVLQAGVNDSFSATNGAESPSPSQGLLNLMNQPSADFDGAGKDRPFGHTFTLPQGKCLQEAKILFRARPLSISPSPGSRNDAVRLGFVNPAGQFVGPNWAAYFGTGNTGLPALLAHQWQPSSYASGASFVLNLAGLPGAITLLPDLDAIRSLDFYVQDDTSVDYITLVYRLCDCPTPTPTRTLTRTRTPTPTITPTPLPSTPTETPTPGPCFISICKQTTPAGGTGFTFSSAWNGLQGITLDDGVCTQKQVGCSFVYNVFEIPQPGSTLTNIACGVIGGGSANTNILGATVNPTSGFEAGDNEVIFSFNTSGVTLECLFTNRIPTPTITGTPTRTPTASVTRTNTATSTPTPTASPTSTRTCIAPPPGMVAWWPLDESAGATSLLDIIGANNATPYSSPVGAAQAPQSTSGVVGGAIGFPKFGNGLSGSRVSPQGALAAIGSADFTIDAWVEFPPTVANKPYYVVNKFDSSLNRGYGLYVISPATTGNQRLEFRWGDGSTVSTVQSIVPLPVNQWHHVAVTFARNVGGNALDIRLYVNGAQQGQQSGNPPGLGSLVNSIFLEIGSQPGAFDEDIIIDELEIFSRALDAQEVDSLFKADSAGKCKPSTPTPTTSATRPPTPTPSFTSTPVPTSTATTTATASPTRTPTGIVTTTATPTASPSGTRTCVSPPANMVAWWTLDDAPGSATVIDIGLPPPNNGTSQPGPIESPPGGGGPGAVAGNLVTSPPDSALFFYSPTIYVEVPHSSELNLANSDLTIDAWVKPLPGPWTAGRDDLHVYTVVDKLNAAATSGYAFYVEVESSCPTCPPVGQQPPPTGVLSTTTMRLVLALGDTPAPTTYRSAPIYTGSGLLFPFPTPPAPLSPQPQGWVHAAVTVDRAQNQGKFYKDGVHLVGIGSDFTPIAGVNNAEPLWIGATRLYGTALAPGFAEFTLNEIEIFNVPLLEPEILSIAAADAGKCKEAPASTATPTASFTPTQLPSHTPTATPSRTLTRPPTASPTATKTATSLPTRTPTRTATRTPTRTGTRTPTASVSPTATSCLGEICATKFVDLDHDGLRDPGEPDIAGWSVHVTNPVGTIIATLITGIQGCTNVSGMTSYTLSEVLQSGWTQTFPPSGTHNVFVECGQAVNVVFGNFQNPISTPTRTPTAKVPPVD